MDRTALTITLVIVNITCFSSGEQGGSACNSLQYLEFGRPGTVSCAFVEQFFGVFWYNSTDVSDESRPIIYYTNSQKDGEGYLSGEFDVFPNGSFIIKNVSLQHEHAFTVIMFKAITEAPVTINVSVVVIVKPRQKFPTINICGDKRVCFWKIDQPVMMFCYVNDSRPAVNLTLATRTVYGDQQLMATPLLQQQNRLHTSTVVMHVPIRAFVTLYVCKVNEPPVLMENNETAILVQSSNCFNSTEVKPVQRFAEKGENVNINCSCSSYNSTLYVIWIRQETEIVAHNIAYNVMWQGNWINETNDRYYITDYSNLVIPDITVKDEGIYACVTGDGIQEKVTTVNITVYVQPNPQYLTVDGCIGQQNCLLSVRRTGTLTCRLHRVRPIVSLQWRFVDESSRNKFQTGILTVTEASEGSTYDITFSSEYSTEDDSSDTIQVECFVDEKVNLPLDWSTWSKRLDLLVPQMFKIPTIENLLSTTLEKLLFSLLIVTPVTIAVIVAIFFCCKKSMAWKKINFTDIEDDEVLLMSILNSGKLDTLRKALKRRYKEICVTLKPLPNSTSTYCIDELYIDGGLKVWSKNELGEERWTDLSSYHSIIGNHSESSDRVIIQGDSGFGKTLLCCKMAHDWYSEDKSSPFWKADILIYLHARLLAELPLCHAIKHHLLPIDTNLSTKDIQGLLLSVSSIIVIDGFNRVPVSGSYDKSELNHILMNKMFQNCTVILTALPNFLPENYSPITKRMKLVGFSDKARNDYIRDKVAKKDPKAQEIITSFFEHNPEIFKFCHVPLFFVLLSHYSYQNKIPIINDARKVTDIFHQIILALNRYEEETEDNVNDGEQLCTVVGNDKELESVALKRILKSQKGFRFKKEKLKRKVGKTLYDKYITLGLLIEEQVVNYTIGKSTSTNQRTEVKFYHAIFLEWYAAQELSRIAEHSKQRDLLRRTLDKINPLNHQYVFRFACGLNERAAVNIVRYLEKKGDDYEKFAQLCIAEQKGGTKKVNSMVSKLCSKPVTIDDDDSVLYQRSVVQLLETASKYDIRIEVLWLDTLTVSFSSERGYLEFGSGVQLSALQTLQQLSITHSTKFTEDEFAGLLTYASLCQGMMSFRLRKCLLPDEVPYFEAMAALEKRCISVEWILPVGSKSQYCLNLQSGLWEHKGQKMTDDEYARAMTVK